MKQLSQKVLLVIWICSAIVAHLDVIFDFSGFYAYWLALIIFCWSFSTWFKGRKKNK